MTVLQFPKFFPALEVVGRLTIPPPALEHYHFDEAVACAEVIGENRERVIGTENKAAPHAQLYGWGPNVAKHIDETGWVYLMPLRVRRSILYAGKQREFLRAGTVYRLHDFVTHWTRDRAPVVCAFAGVFEAPDDAHALAMISIGMAKLAAGMEDAPRVSAGFRAPKKSECYADTPNGKLLVPLKEARKRRWLIATCADRSDCNAPAIMLDSHWPYHWEGNRCRTHFRADAA